MFMGREFLCVPFLGARKPSTQGQRMRSKEPALPSRARGLAALPQPPCSGRGEGDGSTSRSERKPGPELVASHTLTGGCRGRP